MATLPPNWREDEMVVGALFSPFRSRHVNPVGYDFKMAFWRRELADLCRQRRQLLLSWRRLEAEHIVGHHRPSCLQEVFHNLRSSGETVTPAELRRQCAAGRSWAAWGAETLLWRPVRACWNWAKQAVWPSAEQEQELVLLEALKERSDELYARHLEHLASARPAAGALMLTDQVWELHRGLLSGRAELELVLLQLELSGLAVTTDVDGRPAVKFRLQDEQGRPQVTELERGVLRLTMVEKSMMEQVEQLEGDQKKLRSDAKTLIQSGQKESAKKQFRQWKRNESVLEKRLNTLNNVQGVLQTIEDSKYNRKVLDALSRGTAAVKGAFGDVTLDKVDQVVADCQEALADHEEVKSTLARPLSPIDVTETAELEAELNDLLSGGATPQPRRETPQPRRETPQPRRETPQPRRETPDLLPTDLPSPPSESPVRPTQARPRTAALLEPL